MNITRSNFIDLIDCISKIKIVCPSIDMTNGFIRQKFNDGTSLLSVNFSKILPEENTFTLTSVDQAVDLLDNFSLGDKDETVQFIIRDGYLHVSDKYTEISIKLASKSSTSNIFLEDETFKQSMDSGVYAEDTINIGQFTLTVDNTLKRFKSIANKISLAKFNIEVNNDGKASIMLTGTNEKSIFDNLFDVNDELCRNISVMYSFIPFVVDFSTDVKVTVFFNPNTKYGFLKLVSTIKGMDIEMFSAGIEEHEYSN